VKFRGSAPEAGALHLKAETQTNPKAPSPLRFTAALKIIGYPWTLPSTAIG
jgi:hypothetical protein